MAHSKCPFFNRSKNSDLNSIFHLQSIEINHLPFFEDSLSISDFISMTADALSVGVDCADLIEIFHSNFIYDFGALKMLQVHYVKGLGLPLLLEEEIERVVLFYRVQVERSSRKSIDEVFEKPVRSILMEQDVYSADDVKIARANWNIVKESNLLFELTRGFYSKFLESNETGRKLFEGMPMDQQAETLGRMIDWIIGNLEDVNSIVEAVRHSGGRHSIYGVIPGDFVPFTLDFVSTLREVLGPEVITLNATLAWNNILRYLAKEMILGSEAFEKGECFKLEFLDMGEEEFTSGYFRLKIDRLLLCYDTSYSTIKREWNLKGLKLFEIVEDDVFQITSSSPPFTLKFKTKENSDVHTYEEKFTWRIKALARLRRPKTITPKENVEDFVVVQKTWSILTSSLRSGYKIEDNAVNQFFEDVYNRLKQKSTMFTTIFGGIPFLRAIPVLIKMINVFVNTKADAYLDKIGGIHQILELKNEDINVVALCTCDSLQFILGDAFPLEHREVWTRHIKIVGEDMLERGKVLEQGIQIMALRRRSSGGWQTVGLLLCLSELHIYKGSKFKHFLTSISLSRISVDREENDFFEKPTEFCLEMEIKHKKYFYCLQDRKDFKFIMEEIQWRIRINKMKLGISVSKDDLSDKKKKKFYSLGVFTTSKERKTLSIKREDTENIDS